MRGHSTSRIVVSSKKALIYILEVLALSVLYHLTARIGLSMAYVQINTSPVWPPMGIAVAALVLIGYRMWPGVTIGVLIGSVITGAMLSIAVGMALANTLEALLFTWLLKRFVGFHVEMDRIRDVVGVTMVSVLSASLGATIGTSTLLVFAGVSASAFWSIWSTWWIGDLLGALVVAPVLLVWISSRVGTFSIRQRIEGLLVLTLLAFLSWYVFVGRPPEGVFHQALIYMVFPFVIWAALRFGQHGAATSTIIVSGIATWGTVQGLGPFSLESINDGLVLLQTFMAVVSLTALVLGAATLERKKTAASLNSVATQNALLLDQVRTTNRRLRALSQRHIEAHEHERLRLSRELHDESGQMLAALNVKLGLVERKGAAYPEIMDDVSELRSTVGLLQENLHRVAADLRPASLDHLGLVNATQQYIREIAEQHDLIAQFDAQGLNEIRLSAEIEIALFRIIQESLTNVIHHANATRVDVVLDSRNSHILAIIEDDGIGFYNAYEDDESHLGIFGMRERVQMLGGEITIDSEPGSGTAIRIEVPIHD